MSRIAATCYLLGSRLGVVFDDFGSTHGVISIYMLLPCLYKASKTCQNDLMESADIGKERDRGGTVVICRGRRENLTILLRIRRVKPQKGNSIFYLPKEFSMTK